MKKYILLILISLSVINVYGQRRKINLNQADARFTIWAEAHYNSVNDEYMYYYIQNNTNEKYLLEVEVTLNSSCHPEKTFKLGVNRVVFLNPNELFTPSSDYSHISTGKSNAKDCRLKIDKDTYTFINSISYRYTSIKNVTEEENLKAEEKQKKEALALEQKKQKEADALEKKEKEKKEAADLKFKKEAEAEELKKKKEEELENTKIAKEKEETSAKADKDSEDVKQEEIKKEQKIEEEKLQAEEDARVKKEEKEKAAEKLRQEEERQAQERQQEYDTWRKNAQADRDQQDLINTGATFTLFTLLGGFIYDGMGEVDPASVYVAPAKKFVPKFFFNSDFGFSFSADPILFQSSFSTMSGGSSSTNNSLIPQDGYYLNINADVKIGAGNDFYSFYGLIGGKIGLVPTFTGSRYEMGYGGGADIGIKNIKVFGQYRSSFVDEKSIISSDVEENGTGELSALSSEIYYGLKVSFGGNPTDDFKRSHIYLGLMSKQYIIEDKTRFYDPDLNKIKSGDINPINGYMFEWKKDHTFKLSLKYYENYNYIGTVDGATNISSTLNSSGSYFEIGFLRALDFF
jgi:hypothetical protein